MDKRERIIKVMEELKLNSKEFSYEVGITSSALSHILNGRNKASLDILTKILKRFKNISSDWLILGEGSMYRQKTTPQQPSLFPEEDETLLETVSYPENKNTSREAGISSVIEQNIQKKENLPNVTSLLSLSKEKEPRRIKKIIVYFDDKSFQEFGEE